MKEEDKQVRLAFTEQAGQKKAENAVTPDYNQLFIKRLLELERSKNPYEKFRDFCEMAYCAFAKRTAPSKEATDKLEARYMEIVGTYRDKDTVRAYPELLAYTAQSIANGQECLGVVGSELELLDSRNGQFFTPYEVSKLMSHLTFKTPDQTIEKEGFFTVHEPASGSGGMILSLADVVEQEGYNPRETMLVDAIDISPLCYYMTYIQLTLRGLPSLVRQGDTLRWEMYQSAYTPPVADFYKKHGRLFDAAPSKPDVVMEPSPSFVQPSPVFTVGEHGQLGLF